MSRRRKADKREIIPDTKFNDKVLSKFINIVMYDGKKSKSEKIVYDALDIASKKLKISTCQKFQTKTISRSINMSFKSTLTLQNTNKFIIITNINFALTIRVYRDFFNEIFCKLHHPIIVLV